MSAVTIPVATPNLLEGVALVIACRVGVVAVAFRAARRLRPEVTVGRLSRGYALLAAALLVLALVHPVWTHVIRTSIVQAFRIPSGAMGPTVLRGDYLLAAKWVYGWHAPFLGDEPLAASAPRRGDLVVFRFPEDPRAAFIKRVVGLSGENVELRKRVVHIDGRAVTDAHARFVDPGYEDRRDDFDPTVMPDDAYFVLGDNRDNSRDSRFWGYLPDLQCWADEEEGVVKRTRAQSLSPASRTKILRKTRGRCHVCGGLLGQRWHADHVRPTSLRTSTRALLERL